MPILVAEALRAVKTLKSKGYKSKLADFTTSFADHKKELHLLLTAQSSLTVRDIKTEVENILSLLQAQTTKEETMDRLVVSMGGIEAVLKESAYCEIALCPA